MRIEVMEWIQSEFRGNSRHSILIRAGREGGSGEEAGLVAEIGFSIHPVLLGGDTPALQPFAWRIELELIEARPIARECVLARYRVVATPVRS